ncbi:DedA family protein [Patescibacteria group bacterium]
MHFDLTQLIITVGVLGLFAIIFAETGLFFGFFLPGDSLLVTAGLLASQGYFNVWLLIPLLCTAAILGDSVGYWFGRKVGPKIFKRKNSLIFRKEYLDRAHVFYEKHGGKTIVLARFVPIIRTFAPIVAGAAQMEYSIFISFNVFGGILWITSMTLLGYFLGNVIPDVDKYLIPIIALIVFLSLVPAMYEYYKGKKEKLEKSIK